MPKRELLRQFFSIGQEPHETVAQFTIRFQDLYRQVADDVSAQHIPDTFLSSLREPLRTTLALTNFANQTIEQVIARVLALDRTQHGAAFSMTSLQNALPQEDNRFRQALQCTVCSGSGHLALECPHRPQCPICQSRSHTVEQCEYNMLNRTTTAPVRQIEPRNTYSRQDERHSYRDQDNDRPRSPDRRCRDDDYRRDDRHDRYDWNDDYDRYDDDRDDRYDQQNSPNDRRNDNRGPHNNRRNNDNRRRDPPQNDPRNSNAPRTNPPTHEAGNQPQPLPHTERADTSNSAAVTCFKCNQPGHYATQCPTTDRGKAPAVNSIMADVQTVTTRSKAQATQWQVQDEVRQAAKEWIDTANKNNVVRMQTEMRDAPSGAPQSSAPSTSITG